MVAEASGKFDLEGRTFRFAAQVRVLVRRLPRTLCNTQDARQLVRSSGSVGANYIEANESLSKKDFRFRIKIARKEAKESRYWLRLLDLQGDPQLERDHDLLAGESTELMNIFGAMLRNSE